MKASHARSNAPGLARLLLFGSWFAASLVHPAPCETGSVAGLPCSNIGLHARVPLDGVSATPSGAADIWGFTDLNTNREYAIVGYTSGTGIFDVTDPGRPREVGFVAGQLTTWRDIKVYQYYDAAAGRYRAYAYVTADQVSEGLFVIDLGELPQRVSRVAYTSDFGEAHNLFMASVDHATGLALTDRPPTLVIAGSNLDGGRFRSYSVANPAVPVFIAGPEIGISGYIHDGATMIVEDARKDTQCLNAGANCEILLDFNESSIDIWEVSDPASPAQLSRTGYSNTGYTHSGWPTEDGRFLFVNDELDEANFGLPTTLRVFALDDLTAPTEVGAWTGPDGAIDHNGFVRGNRYYLSNYSRGLTVLDISEPAAPTTAGRLDTYPASDAVDFVGAWGAYPYFPSGTLAVSDTSGGLFLAADEIPVPAAGTLGFDAASFGVTEGGSTTITVARTGGSTGAVGVTYRLIAASGDAADVTATIGTLAWGDGESGTRTVSVDALADGIDEPLERLLARLEAPTGGASLSTGGGYASLYIADAGAQTQLGFSTANIDVEESGFGTAVVTLRRDGSAAGPASVDFSLSDGTAIAGEDFTGATSGTVTWADGDANPKSLEFSIIDDGVTEAAEFFELTLSGASAAPGAITSVRIGITDGDRNTGQPGGQNGFGTGGGGGLGPASTGSLLLLLALFAGCQRAMATTRTDPA